MVDASTVELFRKILNRNLAPVKPLPPAPKPFLPRIQLSSNRPSVDPASYILRHATSGAKAATDPISKQGAETEEPGALSKIFDLASAPLYAVTNTVSDFLDDPSLSDIAKIPGNIGGAGARVIENLGLIDMPTDLDNRLKDYAGEVADKLAPRKYGSDLLEQAGVDNNIAQGVGGFALDVALDPLTYVPFGFIGSGSKAAARAGKNIAKEATPVARKGKSGNALPFIKQTPKLRETAPAEQVMGRTIGTPSFPLQKVRVPKDKVADTPIDTAGARSLDEFLNSPEGRAMRTRFNRSEAAKASPLMQQQAARQRYQKDFAEHMRDKKLAKNKKVSDKRGNISFTSVENVIKQIREGTVPKVGPEAPVALPYAEKVAKRVTDRLIDNRLTATGKTITFTPNTQRDLFTHLLNTTGQRAKDIFGTAKMSNKDVRDWRHQEAVRMLRSAEDHAIKLGKNPQYWNGQQVRLSDILATTQAQSAEDIISTINYFSHRNLEKVGSPVVRQAIEDALARRSVTSSDILTSLSSRAAEAKNVLNNYPNTNPVKTASEKALIASTEKLARTASLTPEETKAVKDIVRNIVDVDKFPTEMTLDRLGPELLKAAFDKRANPAVIDKINHKIAAIVNADYKKLGKSITGNKAIDTFMAHMTTWYGRELVKPMSDDVLIWGERNAQERAKLFRNRMQKYSEDERKAAFRVAQGLDVTEDVRLAGLASEFTRYMDTMLKDSGAAAEKVNPNSVALRSMMTMQDVNKQLRRVGEKFQFIGKKNVRDLGGTTYDFSKGFDWMDSWKVHNPSDPASFFYNLDLAIERVMKEYTLLDEIAGRWGSLSRSGDNVHTINHPRLSGNYWFPKEIRDQSTRLLEDLEREVWRPDGELGRLYLRGLRAWKTGVTIYNPAHHIRNLIGDVHLMWWAGHNDVRVFGKSKRILHTQRKKYQEVIKGGDSEGLSKLTAPSAFDESMTRPGDVISRVGKTSITAEQYYIAAYQRGLLLDANILEDVYGDMVLNTFVDKAPKILKQPLGGRASAFARKSAEYREHYVRLAHFIAATEKGLKKKKKLFTAMDDAAHEVRKWHPDGRDLTVTEQKFGRTLIPFYSWTRKSIPLIMQTLVTRPAKITYYPKMMLGLQETFGIEGGTMIDPFPDDQLFPDWIRSYGVGPVGIAGGSGAAGFIGALGKSVPDEITGEPEGYTMANPGNPFQDTLGQLFGTGSAQELAQGIGEQLTPAARIPMEVMMGREMIGPPISHDPSGYVTENIPIAAPFSRMFNYGFFGPTSQAEKDKTHVDKEAILNWLTAAGIRGTGPYEKMAEFEARERARRNNGN